MLLTRGDAAKLAAIYHCWGKRVVLSTGCFDLLHPGHVYLLEEAKARGDFLFVGLNSSATIEAMKGAGRPVMGEGDRLRMVDALRCVDYVFLFDDPDPTGVIQEIRPNYFVKGDDWRCLPEAEAVALCGGEVVKIERAPCWSTSEIIRRVRG